LTAEHSSQFVTAPGGIFATTHWTVVLAAGKRHTPQADVALEELCRTYWFLLYARAGASAAEALPAITPRGDRADARRPGAYRREDARVVWVIHGLSFPVTSRRDFATHVRYDDNNDVPRREQ
jgi:hypothetical protein